MDNKNILTHLGYQVFCHISIVERPFGEGVEPYTTSLMVVYIQVLLGFKWLGSTEI